MTKIAKHEGTSLRDAPVETWEDHVEAWHHFGRDVENAMWGRAAVAASLRHRYGEKAIEKFANGVGQGTSTVRQLAQVHETFPENARRLANLSFYHHVTALQAKDPTAALEKAEAEGWSGGSIFAPAAFE